MVVSKTAKGFDAGFYLSHYDDLKHIKSKIHALSHYLRRGKSEGRFPNEKAYFSHAISQKSDIGSEFDILAYKFYNKDLVSVFESDQEFFQHYLRHGRKEERISRFPHEDSPEDYVPTEEKWKNIFSASEFIAWAGGEIGELPKSRKEAVEAFYTKGIDKLSPVNFDYVFDANFVRANNFLLDQDHKSDTDLYRYWLTEGFPTGIAPNERIFLASYLDSLPFPSFFDWRTFVKRSGMPSATTRSQALIALFNQPSRKTIRDIGLLGQDAAWLLDRIGRRALAHGEHAKAIVMFTQSIAIAPAAEPLCLLGDANREVGATREALAAYVASIEIGHGPLKAFLHAATIYASRKEFFEAFDVLRKAHRLWRQKGEFGRKLHEVVQLYFDHQSAQAHAIYRGTPEQSSDLVKREAGDALLTDTLDQIRALYLELDSLPAPRGADPEGYVAILANDDLRQCAYYRIEQKKRQFESAGIPVKIFSHFEVQEFFDSLIGARAVIFYRVAAVPGILRAILHATSMNLDTYYEVDDLIFDSGCYPDPFPSFEGQISATEYAGLQFGVPLFRYAMAMCKGSIASTPALAERMQTVTATDANIIIRNGLDERNDVPIMMGANPIRRSHGERVRIFYGSGTKAHNADFNRLVAPAVLDLMQRHPHVDLVIVGHLKLKPELSAMGERIFIYPFIPDVTNYWSVLASCDINLAVLEAGIVADCKSEIKWLEAAVLQIPSIVSGTRTYREVIENGVDGFIVDTATEWRDALQALIISPHRRAQVGAEAREKALRDYDIEVAAQKLKTIFGTPFRSNKRDGRLRVLVCNVFFAPQSYGGATRVVEDNVRTFIDQYSDLDIAIFCSDEGAIPAGRLSMGVENNIPVYRLSTPQEVDMEWRPFNEAHAEPFERVLDHFKPDLIHFHCIQRLTATIVEVALRREIPYVVTLHDAWWISDNQFLIDGDGLLQLPGVNLLGDCANSRSPLKSIARRQRLASLLQNSEANLSVSAPFAKIYAEAGIARLQVVENGTPLLGESIRSSRPDGRVALGHVGGRSAHKGASLIEASLRRGSYENLHLTMIDGTLAPGQMVQTIWGTTPVTLMAPFPQTQVGQLYGQLDVLLAPSTWPESFGLVTREALSSGLWVVASNLGAIGQEVENDRNGYLIDVATTKDLNQVLSMIDANPGRYRGKPPVLKRVVRTMSDQAAEFHAIYREMGASLN